MGFSPWGCRETHRKQISLQWLPYRTVYAYIAFVLSLKFASREVSNLGQLHKYMSFESKEYFIHSFIP